MNRRQKKKSINKLCIKFQDGCGIMPKVFYMSKSQLGHTFNSFESYLEYKKQVEK